RDIVTLKEERMDSAVFALQFSPEGTILASQSGNGIVKLWRAATEEEVQTSLENTLEHSQLRPLIVTGLIVGAVFLVAVIVFVSRGPGSHERERGRREQRRVGRSENLAKRTQY